ncbi:hypothetical protein COEREDRAFT_7993 [Coemansia reversa NRRL 1564]|uniref:Kinetochore protein Spc24 n=1 Tax=Coemansia reversa (strain ATCC 12441 / NRRL 1564) TaxID=763665 RepID=A0A2G5BCU4_COERN|nr:hypothetical protein COEREDRAFT_7993 [Coemansia reversa NRRL 1564]|eukprot:PIA16844.1 hypothetical protein COEREDRAFT_7993 [Coemansia reversa NRRL 1564]
MPVEELAEQRDLMQSTVANLKHSNESQLCRDLSQQLESLREYRRTEQDKMQEQLKQLSRRLQDVRSRVDASKAQREQKSHAEVMRDLEAEKQAAADAIAAQESRQTQLNAETAVLEKQLQAQDDNIEHQMVPDEGVLMLQILRGLGVEPLTNVQTGLVESARVWTPKSAYVVPVCEDTQEHQPTPHQLAARLWDLCS